ncbi:MULTISPECIES: serine/threonine-protein kinase [Rhodococcus]|uniref:non-specific serine/threonine protein kinase n=1 Tax=Rhodococcus rhodochrous TaxID=1829 RepID=A0AAW4XD53_RHORH|nr:MULTISPECIES: serine/threonine-protein kinase [Rhodococcus]MCD2110983.1 protein kinase [Rhodococcus rhodochrous]QHG83020.1 serine/threonine protein kinase [Rhodococcus rhodochrous]QOH57297.1 serine/threonine protein kinase [Rhodococcus rhodochrous]WAL44912.1 protein kinase [Rhodococcus pyridinivorans]
MGETFGRYELQTRLGQGGMGQVWCAFDSVTDRQVAVKVLPPELADDAGYRARFDREARAVSKLRHPNIVPIHNFGEIDGRLYIDMALLEGEDLGTVLRREGSLPLDRTVRVIGQVAAALDAAHDAGLVHRDVKPANIVLHPSGHTYLIDFGIAHADGQTALTREAGAIGTLAYMAPERFDGRSGPGSDIYALTCVLFQCLTGRAPFATDSTAQHVASHLTKPPPRPTDLVPGLPAALDGVVARGMAKRVEDRYRRAGELAEDLARSTMDRRPPRGAPVPLRKVEPGPPPTAVIPPTAVNPSSWTGPPTFPNRPPMGPPPPPSARAPRRGAVVALAVAAAVIAVGAVLAFVLGRDTGDSPSAGATSPLPAETSTPSTVPSSPGSTSPEPTSSESPPSFERMATFVRDYYALLPDDTEQAWALFDPHYAGKVGRAGFEEFWPTIRSVSVDAVEPRDASSVIVTLTFVTVDGRTESEKRWVSVVENRGRLSVYDSERIGAA